MNDKRIVGRLVALVKFPYLWLRYGSSVKADETVILFPQSANKNNHGWTVPVHAWVIEKEDGTVSRLLGKHSVLSFLGLAGVVSRRSVSSVFENRLSWFMADREINKRVSVTCNGEKFISPRTGANGHVKFTIDYCGSAPAGSEIKIGLDDLPDGMPPVQCTVQLVAEQGLSVISDIDDTIKISKVTDKRELVRGLFFEDYHVAPGMPEFYRQLADVGVSFHYVSASPWQLYPSLAPFMDKYFPFGCLSQRHFYIGDKSFVDFFRSSMEYKIKTISRLLNRFPQRQFILIGDSGEKDPEVYLQIAQQFANQVSDILIREVYAESELSKSDHAKRWQAIRAQLAAHQTLIVFALPDEVELPGVLSKKPVSEFA